MRAKNQRQAERLYAERRQHEPDLGGPSRQQPQGAQDNDPSPREQQEPGKLHEKSVYYNSAAIVRGWRVR